MATEVSDQEGVSDRPLVVDQQLDDALAAAYADHAAVLHRRLYWLTRDDAAAEDLAHEAFVRLIREARAGRMPDNVGGWLQRVGTNLVASGARHSKVEERHQARLVNAAAIGTPEDHAEHRENERGMTEALGRLDPSDRTAIVLAAQGFNRSEMAQLMGRSESATRTLLCRARARLRITLLTS